MLSRLLRHHRMKPERFADVTSTPLAKVAAWMNGDPDPPSYVRLALLAVAKGCAPADDRDVTEEFIGEPLAYQRAQGNVPLIMCYAVAGQRYQDASRRPLTPSEIDALRRIDVGRYYRTPTVYRSLPVMGKAMAGIRRSTVDRLTARGLVKADSRGAIWLTTRGKDAAER